MTPLTESAFPGREVVAEIIGRQSVSNWFEVTQKQIDVFSEATNDHQWIHKSNVEQGHGPFGGPIAHGLLLVSLALYLARGCGALPEGTWVLCGFDNLRFRAPVHSGTRVRCLTVILGLQELGERRLLNVGFSIEIEGGRIPALTTKCSLLCLNRTA
jgi:acyl dehydratase